VQDERYLGNPLSKEETSTAESTERSLTWVYPKDDIEWTKAISQEFNIDYVIAQVLAARNFSSFDEIHNYLYAKLPNLFPPEAMLDIEKAVNRIEKARTEGEGILIYGDNDVDGMTGTALLVEYLKTIDVNVCFYVPNRSELKHNILMNALEYGKENNCKLFITVDCGITAAEDIERLISSDIEVIVTDHHEPTAQIPNCVATLNPKLLTSQYPNRDLTGVGVAFKLIHAYTNFLVRKRVISPMKIDLKHYLDLVALGTIADMGALNGENRILVRYGLRELSNSGRVGITKLIDVCEMREEEMTTTDIASKVAPRLNSLGRIADPMKGVELLLLRDPKAAEELAKELDLNNSERQKLERRDTLDIEDHIEKHPEALDHKAIVLSSDKWHPGIIPIITARIAKRYNRPTVLIAIENGLGKGSSRTIPEYPLLPALQRSRDLLLNYGGHDYAAGLMIEDKNIPQFTEEFLEMANEGLKEQDIVPKLHLDAPVNFASLTFEFLDSLALLEPFGTGNSAPIFYCNAKQTWPPKVVGKTHLKLYLEQNDRVLEGIAFGFAERRGEICKKNITLQIAFTPYMNTFLNKSSIQLLIRDFRIIEDQAVT
jgi:single-stranded-DNA-specific exonuclease